MTSESKYSELKAAALAATPGPWAAELNEVWVISDRTADFMLTDIFGDNELSAQQDCANARFIAAANPAAVLALLAERDSNQQNYHNAMEELRIERSQRQAADKRIAELEASETQLIQERDSAEQALADMYEAAIGERPEWSNWFGFSDAVEKVSLIAAVSKQEKDEK